MSMSAPPFLVAVDIVARFTCSIAETLLLERQAVGGGTNGEGRSFRRASSTKLPP